VAGVPAGASRAAADESQARKRVGDAGDKLGADASLSKSFDLGEMIRTARELAGVAAAG
jgi:hypothetical protein